MSFLLNFFGSSQLQEDFLKFSSLNWKIYIEDISELEISQKHSKITQSCENCLLIVDFLSNIFKIDGGGFDNGFFTKDLIYLISKKTVSNGKLTFFLTEQNGKHISISCTINRKNITFNKTRINSFLNIKKFIYRSA